MWWNWTAKLHFRKPKLSRKPRTEIENQNKARNLGMFSGTELGTDGTTERTGTDEVARSPRLLGLSLALHVQTVLNGVRNRVVTVGAPSCDLSPASPSAWKSQGHRRPARRLKVRVSFWPIAIWIGTVRLAFPLKIETAFTLDLEPTVFGSSFLVCGIFLGFLDIPWVMSFEMYKKACDRFCMELRKGQDSVGSVGNR